MRLSLSDEARRDLREMHRHGIREYGERAAEAYLESVMRTFDHIVEWPLAARLRTEVRPPIRLMRLSAHNIFYDLSDKEIQIVRVLHHTADWINLL